MQPHHIADNFHSCWIFSVDGSVRAGFPSPAEDYGKRAINLSELLIQHPQATFFMKVAGDSMCDAGIFNGDHVLVDRAVQPEPGHIVVAVVDNEFTLKYLRRRHGRYFLEAANRTYPRIYPAEEGTLEVWGVARTSFRALPGFQIKG